MSGERFWIWVAICVAAWFAAAWLIAAFCGFNELDDDFDIDGHRWPIDNEDES